METYAQIVRLRAEDDKVGLCFDDRSWTWREVVQEAADRSAAVAALVSAPEDRQIHIGVLLENVPDFVFWLSAGSLAGAVVVGINASRSGPELAQDIRHADVDVIITEGRLVHLVDGTGHGLADDRIWNVDSEAYRQMLAPFRGSALPATLPTPKDLALLLFSSGSSGTPKAVIVSQERLARLVEALVERIRMRRDSVTYLSMPLFHGNAIMMNLATATRVGATVGMRRRFSASQFSDDVHRFGATYVNYVGRALSYVLSTPTDPRDANSTLELAFGTEASEADVAGFAERFGCEVSEGYGMSEGVFRLRRTHNSPPGSLGLPQGDLDIRVYDEETGAECPRAQLDATGRLTNPEAVGQMVAVGLAHTFEGYYKNPEAMADRVRGEDFWSGDLAYRDADGYFYFAGRSSDWLRVDSENIAAALIERVLQRVPGVASTPVFAVPDPRTGDQVMAAVEMNHGHLFDAAKFGACLEQDPEMGAKWWPTYVRVTKSIPLTGSGKVNKARLRTTGWHTDDSVYIRIGNTASYELLRDAHRAEIEAEFRAHGRSSLLPSSEPGA